MRMTLSVTVIFALLSIALYHHSFNQIYIMGSLARGGFSEATSDIDIDSFSGTEAELVKSAYYWRFNSLPKNLDTVVESLDKGITKLYFNFINTCMEQMELYNEHELKLKLFQWKKK